MQQHNQITHHVIGVLWAAKTVWVFCQQRMSWRTYLNQYYTGVRSNVKFGLFSRILSTDRCGSAKCFIHGTPFIFFIYLYFNFFDSFYLILVSFIFSRSQTKSWNHFLRHTCLCVNNWKTSAFQWLAANALKEMKSLQQPLRSTFPFSIWRIRSSGNVSVHLIFVYYCSILFVLLIMFSLRNWHFFQKLDGRVELSTTGALALRAAMRT